MPSRRVAGPPASSSRSACPPIPIVPSTTQPSPRGRKRNVTSSTRTGRCIVASRSGTLDSLVRQPLEEIVERSAAVSLLMIPALLVPHLERRGHADDHDVLHEPDARSIVGGDLNAALGIEGHVLPVREIRVADPARVWIEARERAHLCLELLPEL